MNRNVESAGGRSYFAYPGFPLSTELRIRGEMDRIRTQPLKKFRFQKFDEKKITATIFLSIY